MDVAGLQRLMTPPSHAFARNSTRSVCSDGSSACTPRARQRLFPGFRSSRHPSGAKKHAALRRSVANVRFVGRIQAVQKQSRMAAVQALLAASAMEEKQKLESVNQDPPRHLLSQRETQILKNVYDRSGGLSGQERIARTLVQVGQNVGTHDLQSLLAESGYNTSRGGIMTLEQFMHVMQALKTRYYRKCMQPDRDAVEAFVSLGGGDATGSDTTTPGGRVETERLRKVVDDFQLLVDIDTLIREFDRDKSGVVDFIEFKAMLEGIIASAGSSTPPGSPFTPPERPFFQPSVTGNVGMTLARLRVAALSGGVEAPAAAAGKPALDSTMNTSGVAALVGSEELGGGAEAFITVLRRRSKELQRVRDKSTAWRQLLRGQQKRRAERSRYGNEYVAPHQTGRQRSSLTSPHPAQKKHRRSPQRAGNIYDRLTAAHAYHPADTLPGLRRVLESLGGAEDEFSGVVSGGARTPARERAHVRCPVGMNVVVSPPRERPRSRPASASAARRPHTASTRVQEWLDSVVRHRPASASSAPIRGGARASRSGWVECADDLSSGTDEVLSVSALEVDAAVAVLTVAAAAVADAVYQRPAAALSSAIATSGKLRQRFNRKVARRGHFQPRVRRTMLW